MSIWYPIEVVLNFVGIKFKYYVANFKFKDLLIFFNTILEIILFIKCICYEKKYVSIYNVMRF